jgi:hypothetical protein
MCEQCLWLMHSFIYSLSHQSSVIPFFFFFETESHYVAKTSLKCAMYVAHSGLKLLILLPQHPYSGTILRMYHHVWL